MRLFSSDKSTQQSPDRASFPENLSTPDSRPRLSRKFPLRWVLIVPFLVQIFAAVGLVGWFSFRNGQRAIETLAWELQGEIGKRIEDRLKTYTELPVTINRMNADLARSQWLNLDDLSQLQQHFLRQLLWFPDANISYISWGNEKGEFTGAFRSRDGTFELILADRSTRGDSVRFLSDRNGNIGIETLRVPGYDSRARPWYQSAVKARGPAWTSPYPWTEGTLGLDYNLAFYQEPEPKQLQGVFNVSLDLDNISTFLQSLEIGKSGQAFIFERSGKTLGTSKAETLTIHQGEDLETVLVFDSPNPAIRQTAEYLQARFGDLSQIQNTYRDSLKIEGQPYFLQVTAFQDEAGLDWLIAIVIPKADFLAQIYANTRMTIWLCLLALGVASTFGILTSRWIAKPILSLNQANLAIAQGHWEQQVATSHINELESLGISFNQMSQELKRSREQLADYSRSLEQKVLERTAELAAEQEKSERLLLSILPKPIAEQLKKAQSILWEQNKKQPVSAVAIANKATAKPAQPRPVTEKPPPEQKMAPVAEHFDEVTILFADIVDFTALSAQMTPTELVNLLNQIFSSFDRLAEHHGLEKIKTVGDGYLVVGGLPIPKPDRAEAIARMALDMQREVSRFRRSNDGKPFQLRIGINTGPVVAGVIGMKKFSYDLWGDAVNVASRMESQGEPGKIQVTVSTYEQLRGKYRFEHRGSIPIKGKGTMDTYWLYP